MKDEFIGLSVVEEVVIKCRDCHEPLANIVVTETNENRLTRGLKSMQSKYKVVNCPKCKTGYSFYTPVLSGSVAVGSDNYSIDSTSVEFENGIMVSHLEARVK